MVGAPCAKAFSWSAEHLRQDNNPFHPMLFLLRGSTRDTSSITGEATRRRALQRASQDVVLGYMDRWVCGVSAAKVFIGIFFHIEGPRIARGVEACSKGQRRVQGKLVLLGSCIQVIIPVKTSFVPFSSVP